MTDQTCFVILGRVGEYSATEVWPIAVFSSRADAEVAASRMAADLARELGALTADGVDFWDAGSRGEEILARFGCSTEQLLTCSTVMFGVHACPANEWPARGQSVTAESA